MPLVHIDSSIPDKKNSWQSDKLRLTYGSLPPQPALPPIRGSTQSIYVSRTVRSSPSPSSLPLSSPFSLRLPSSLSLIRMRSVPSAQISLRPFLFRRQLIPSICKVQYNTHTHSHTQIHTHTHTLKYTRTPIHSNTYMHTIRHTRT